jgi:pimeloyl-ACP methyl ester carboxylesterase
MKGIQMNSILYQQVNVDGINVFYREAGSKDLPTLLLLHGFPSSSHMFRDLIPLLSHQFHIVAPDLPGFGRSDIPSHDEFDYTFDNLSNVISSFTEKLGLHRYAIYVFDYGAPVGFRLAVKHPERVTAIISQNGNAYQEGLSDGWNPIRKYWELPNADNREALRSMLAPETTYWQYTHGVPNPEEVSPDGYSLDNYYLDRTNVHEAQLDLFLDYATNVDLYPTFHKYFRDHQPPLLAVWGRHDPFFLPQGASAFKRDLPYARVVFYETGHFALETHASEIAHEISAFLA